MKIITLCGSTKFKEEFEKQNAKLTMLGNIVISVGVFGHIDKIHFDKNQKKMLVDIHKKKIDLSDEIFIINVKGYIGESTRSEILYAESKGIIVKYLIKIKWKVCIEYESGYYEEILVDELQEAITLYDSTDETCAIEVELE